MEVWGGKNLFSLFEIFTEIHNHFKNLSMGEKEFATEVEKFVRWIEFHPKLEDIPKENHKRPW